MTNFQLLFPSILYQITTTIVEMLGKISDKMKCGPLDKVYICSLCKFHLCNSVTEKALGI